MDRKSQLEELESLESIYYSEEFQVLKNKDPNTKLQAIFWAFLTLPDNYTIKYLENLDCAEPSFLKVKHLPPIELRLTLPEEYPSKTPPEFIISCQWLHKKKISLLCRKLDDIWQECGPVEIIYMWCDFLRNDSLNFLGCENELDIIELCSKHLSFLKKLEDDEKRREEWNPKNSVEENKPKILENSKGNIASNPSFYLQRCKDNQNRTYPYPRRYPNCRKNKNSNSKMGSCWFDERAVLNISLRTSPIKLIENYNIEREKVEFSRTFYTCNICFSDKLGRDCTQFKDCNHVFCVNCIRGYFTVRIKDGTVQSIKCPEEKCMSEALPSQVKEIVSEELFAKYDSVLLSTALDTLGDIIYCPRQACQYPVSWEPEEKMASCPNCQFVFCVTCKMVYHGIEPCQMKAGEVHKLVEEYENASDEVRQQIETKYGKKYLQFIVNNSKAEAWIRENSKACPRCEAAIEKSQGCNKMVCWKCNASFCWLCCEILDSKNPYSHFNDQQSRCANKLFHLVYDSDDDDDDIVWDWVNDNDEEFTDSDIDEEQEDDLVMELLLDQN